VSRDGDVNVVASWRERRTMLAREGWACTACHRVSLARRRVCSACGALAVARQVPLARTGVVAALCAAGGAVEHLDQVTGRKAAVLVELDGGRAGIACLLAHADSVSLMGELRGQRVRLAVRRIPLAVPDSDPIPYGFKAALDLDTRAALKAAAGKQAKAAEAPAEPGPKKEQE
jgi:uncharacterized OB-fold protein